MTLDEMRLATLITSVVMLALYSVLVWIVWRQLKTMNLLIAAQSDASSSLAALSGRYEDLNAALKISIDEHAIHRAELQTKFLLLLEIQERFFAQPVVTQGPHQVATRPAESSNAEASTAQLDVSEPSSQ